MSLVFFLKKWRVTTQKPAVDKQKTMIDRNAAWGLLTVFVTMLQTGKL
jgi:hypothetical protein